MREYEVTVVLQPQLEDAERAQVVETVTQLLAPGAEEGDETLTIDHWGERRLAYPINKHREGYYVFYDVKIDPARIRDIEQTMQYNEDILRYLVVRKGE